ncbi:MAG: acyl carrier protein [Pseudomonadota bacterium]
MSAADRTPEAIEARILELLASHVDGGGPFGPETRILADTSFDSVTVMDFILDLEDEFDVSMPLNKMSEIVTVDDLTKALSELAPQS